jgi:hypothetical protein
MHDTQPNLPPSRREATTWWSPWPRACAGQVSKWRLTCAPPHRLPPRSRTHLLPVGNTLLHGSHTLLALLDLAVVLALRPGSLEHAVKLLVEVLLLLREPRSSPVHNCSVLKLHRQRRDGVGSRGREVLGGVQAQELLLPADREGRRVVDAVGPQRGSKVGTSAIISMARRDKPTRQWSW